MGAARRAEDLAPQPVSRARMKPEEYSMQRLVEPEYWKGVGFGSQIHKVQLVPVGACLVCLRHVGYPADITTRFSGASFGVMYGKQGRTLMSYVLREKYFCGGIRVTVSVSQCG